MKIAVIGGGAVGLFLTAKLSNVNEVDVVLITRTEEQAASIQHNQLVFQHGNQQTHLHINTLPISKASSLNVDWILLAVKQQHMTPTFIEQLKYLMQSQSKLLCFQNGYGHIDLLSEKIDVNSIYAAITTEGVLKKNKNQVIHTGYGNTVLGHYINNSLNDVYLNKMNDVLSAAGISSSLSKNIRKETWQKLIINAVINPLTGMMKIKNGDLLTNPYVHTLMKGVFNEVMVVAQHQYADLERDKMWKKLITVCSNTRENKSSTLQDMLNGRQTELEWITGVIIKLAKSHGIQVPMNEMLYCMIKGLEAEHLR
ncbi:2-dehydropantoate 2-reductase [Longirhabdus pacifica]|uniref:2-dehydropantoate 2-reductase n=1 Tax=Longirhabdus pacifica TaxID=2305227 RepID=UPI0010087416|nr:2-dehydropantoate 2-reductase [Longirhabdus pacifica]